MGSFPKLKRRFCCPSSILLATFLSALIVYMFLFARPEYLERLPDVLSLPSHEKEVGESSGPTQNEGSDAQVDEPAQKVAQEIAQEAPKIPETPKMPEVPETPKMPETPETPEMPETTTTTPTIPVAEDPASQKNRGWKYDPTRDASNYFLSSEQCHIAFPGLFGEVERGVAAQQQIGKVTEEQLDISDRDGGALRGMILDQQLYILQETVMANEYDTSRALAILHALHRAIITSPEPIPNMEFSFTVADVVPDPDNKHWPIWGLARKNEDGEIWLMGDFGYWSWPLDLVGAYDEVRREIAEVEMDFAQKKKQAVWRGAVATNSHRQELIKVTENKEWADVRAIQWAGVSDIISEDQAKTLSMPQHCTYQFVIHTEGHSYSGRGKYLQNCNSVVIMHKRTWVEPHHALLVSDGPEQNFVEVAEDFSDLEEKITALLADPEKARKIAQNSVETFRDRYLTPASQVCYWRELLRGWASVSFEPKAWDVDEEGTRTIRGVPFETFVLQSIMVQPKPTNCRWFAKFLGQC